MFFLYGFWGLTTILLFWAALIRATREWGGANLQGRAFGWLDGGRGAVAAVLGTSVLLVFSNCNIDSSILSDISESRIQAFQNVLWFTVAFTILSAVLVWLFVPNNNSFRPSEIVKLKQVKELLRLPSIWLISVIIICGYVGYKTNYLPIKLKFQLQKC